MQMHPIELPLLKYQYLLTIGIEMFFFLIFKNLFFIRNRGVNIILIVDTKFKVLKFDVH